MKYRECLNDFAKYTSLNVIGMIGLSCYILADTYFVARGLGADGLAALNLAIPVYSFIHGCGLMFGMGGATKYSILKSQDAAADANRVFTCTTSFALALSAVFLIVGLCCSSGLTGLLGADDAIFAMTRIYLQVIMLFAPLFILNEILLCFVRNDGAPQLSMAAMIAGSLSNIVLDYIFIFPLGMGIFGAVLATGFAPVISMAVLSPYFLQKRNGFRPTKFKVAWNVTAAILSCGLPSLITEVSAGIVMIVFNTIILGLQGNVGVAAYGVIANLSLVLIAIYTGIAQGIQPLISRSYGGGNDSYARIFLRCAVATVIAVSAAIYLSVFFGASQIAGAFNSENNALLQDIAVAGLKIYFTGGIFAGFNIVLSVYFTSTERATPAHIISALRGFLVIIPMAFLLSAASGMTGVWCAFPLTESVVAAVGLIFYRKRLTSHFI